MDHHLPPRLVPGTGGEAKVYVDHELKRTYETGIFVESNQSQSCISLRQIDEDGETDEGLIHICDWPTLRATVDQYIADRQAAAKSES